MEKVRKEKERMKVAERKLKRKKLTLEYETSDSRVRITGVPGFVNMETGEETIPGLLGIQLLNVLTEVSKSISKIKRLPRPEVEIRFPKVA